MGAALHLYARMQYIQQKGCVLVVNNVPRNDTVFASLNKVYYVTLVSFRPNALRMRLKGMFFGFRVRILVEGRIFRMLYGSL